MKIKKKDLRKGEAQLPINYPAPELDETFAFSLDAEKSRVENLCKRLAHNEVAVREAVLAELPRYLREATRHAEAAEDRIDEEGLRRFIAMQQQKEEQKHQKKQHHTKAAAAAADDDDAAKNAKQKGKVKNGKKNKSKKGASVENDDDEAVVINLLSELDAFRARSTNAQREQLRQFALQRLHEGGGTDDTFNAIEKAERDFHTEEDDGGVDAAKFAAVLSVPVPTPGTAGSLRQMHRAWVTAWAETELLLLKLARGIFFCLWHTDKPLAQLDCAQRIAQLLTQPRTVSGKVLFFSCMMRVLAREWRTMDRYRADKFLALVRRLVHEMLRLLNTLEATTLSATTYKNNNHKKTAAAAAAALNNDDGKEDLKDVTNREPLRRALEEFSYVFQRQVVPEPTAIGLSMHTCDVLFDELCRAAVSPSMFVAVADRIALFAMSQGNYVEKRVLDFFIAPIAGGVLAARRQEICNEQLQQKQKRTPQKHDTEENIVSSVAVKLAGSKRAQGGDLDVAKAQAKAEAETQFILLALANCCKAYAVARRTVRAVRVMFTESEMILRQSADPAAYEALTRTAQRRRIEREVADADETRKAVVAERRNVRMLRSQDFKKLRKNEHTLASSESGADTEGAATTKKQRVLRKFKAAPRSTKRKKQYTLTKKDLHGDDSD